VYTETDLENLKQKELIRLLKQFNLEVTEVTKGKVGNLQGVEVCPKLSLVKKDFRPNTNTNENEQDIVTLGSPCFSVGAYIITALHVSEMGVNLYTPQEKKIVQFIDDIVDKDNDVVLLKAKDLNGVFKIRAKFPIPTQSASSSDSPDYDLVFEPEWPDSKIKENLLDRSLYFLGSRTSVFKNVAHFKFIRSQHTLAAGGRLNKYLKLIEVEWYHKESYSLPQGGDSGGAYFYFDNDKPIICGMHVGSDAQEPFNSYFVPISVIEDILKENDISFVPYW